MKDNMKVINENGYDYLICESLDTNNINKTLCGMLNNNEISQFLPIFFNEEENFGCEYDINGFSSMKSICENEICRDDLLILLAKTVVNIKIISKYFLDENDILLDWDYVYVDNDKNVKFVGNFDCSETSSLVDYIKYLLDNSNFKKDEKKTYIQQLNDTLNKDNLVYDDILMCINIILQNPVEIEKIVEPEPEIEVKPEVVAPPVPPVIADIPPAPPTPPSISKPPVPPSTPVQEDEDSFGETTVLGISNQPMIFPVLIRIKNGEKIVINKTEFAIGKDPSRVDYCIFDNSAISRLHCRIVCKNGEFFVVDNKSTNHVYVNGMLIDANVEVRLTHGVRIRLGDDDFEFRFQ